MLTSSALIRSKRMELQRKYGKKKSNENATDGEDKKQK